MPRRNRNALKGGRIQPRTKALKLDEFKRPVRTLAEAIKERQK